MALGTLESLVDKHKGALAEQAKHSEACPNADSALANGQEQNMVEQSHSDRTERTIVDDLSRWLSAHNMPLRRPHVLSAGQLTCSEQ